MEAYKVFRVEKGKLYSAFEGLTKLDRPKRVHYQIGKLAKDPKPKGFECPGLMVLLSKPKAIAFLKKCGGAQFVLHRVYPEADVRIPVDWFNLGDYNEAFTDALMVGEIKCRIY